ncbi:P-loop containing nucleoside triphosphate hydrolases superfamily protein [Actinidia rufa]|uniref:P-loop containing nucleoside triphosphate hydrolases superfamily protein n=1 Tax=Actinidia rufa TaxID=165716 RepID=A0A7J0F9H2_9ERIC|nr:P-loop containing nucleoside triphosphate hydrolases superfamily protein [Actinidia rufa]
MKSNLQNRAGLRHFLDSFGGTEQSVSGGNSVSAGVSQESSFGFVTNDKLDTKARADVKLSHLATGIDSNTSMQTTEMRLTDLLDSTLWNRRLAPSSERIVYALVQQIFHGIREYFLASAELKVHECIEGPLELVCRFGLLCPKMCLQIATQLSNRPRHQEPYEGEWERELVDSVLFQLLSSNAGCRQVACTSSGGLRICI